MRRRWLAIPLVAGALAIGVLTAGIVTVGSASAQEADTTERTSLRQTFIDKVAGLLDRTPEEVQDTFQQARSEIHDERIEAKLDSLVEAGTITEQDKADILAWLDDKPESVPGMGMMGKRGHGFGMGGNVEDRLARAVENGVMTQDEADDIVAWYETRPAVVDELMQGRGDHGRGFRGRFRGHMNGDGEFQGRFQGRFGNGAGIEERSLQIAPSNAISF